MVHLSKLTIAEKEEPRIRLEVAEEEGTSRRRPMETLRAPAR
jgi:hypothetical protein